MAKRGRPTVEINLSGAERATLERWARRHSSSQALALRSKIVLACAAGDRTQVQIAADLGCNPVTVGKWRNRFAEARLDGLVDAPPSGGGPLHRRRRDRSGRGRDARERTARRHALVDAHAWRPSTGSATPRCERSGGPSGSSPGATDSLQGVARPGPGGKDP